jgi:hyperosmotically inducible periplasmic protein
LKRSRVPRYAAAGLIALATASAYAQNSAQNSAQNGEDTSPVLASATIGPTAREIRAANRQLRRAVLSSLTKTKGLNADRIVVVAKGRVIWLEGYVTQTDQIGLATSAAQGVPGVDTVNNRLIVRAEGL